MKNIVRYLLCGLAMGAADVVPGVSGGTIAFITGNNCSTESKPST